MNVKDLYDASKEIVDLGLDFYGNDEIEAAGKVHRNLGTAVKIQGAGTFTRATGSTNNINVKRNATADGFTVELAENLTGMKEIAGTGTNPLTITNGDTTITVKPSKVADDNKPAEPSSVDFGGAKVTNVGTATADTDATNKKYVDDKVNALRNGEVGPVVYTDDQGNHLVKAKDGKYYKATDVNSDGTVKTAAEAGTTEAPKAVAKPEARLVSPDGSTTGAVTKLSNIAEGEIDATSKDAVTGKQLHATNERVATIEKALDGKADKSTVEALSKQVASKADKSTVEALAKTVEGKADKSDLDKKADEAYFKCKKIVKRILPEMNLVIGEYTFDESKLIFYFTAENRLDFRELVKEVNKTFKKRVEFYQIKSNDEGRILCAFGKYGREIYW